MHCGHVQPPAPSPCRQRAAFPRRAASDKHRELTARNTRMWVFLVRKAPDLTNMGELTTVDLGFAVTGRVVISFLYRHSWEAGLAYRPYRGRRRRGSGWGLAVGALAAGAMAFGVSWYLHVPVPNWIGSRNAEAGFVQMGEPALPPPPPARTAGSIFAEAEAAFANGRWIEAADGYRHVVEMQPDFGPAYTRWTRALTNQHHVAEAAERGRQAVSINSQSPDARAA